MTGGWPRWATGCASVLATVLLAAILVVVAWRDDPHLERSEPSPTAPKHDAAPAAPLELARVHLPPPEAAAEGRARLRMLEHGEGPTIEIAWPDTSRARDRLHDLFTRCYGIRVLLLDGGDRLFGLDGTPGDPWQFDADRFSGFVRAPSGATAAAERTAAETIRRRHGVYGARLVRVFPRRVDTMLLGGLGEVIGSGYADAATIRAAYRVSGGDVVVGDIRIDGRTVPGDIRLARRTCSSR